MKNFQKLNDEKFVAFIAERRQAKQIVGSSKPGLVKYANGLNGALNLFWDADQDKIIECIHKSIWKKNKLNSTTFYPEYYSVAPDVQVYGFYNMDSNMLTSQLSISGSGLRPSEVVGSTKWLPIHLNQYLRTEEDLEMELEKLKNEYAELVMQMEADAKNEGILPVLLVAGYKMPGDTHLGIETYDTYVYIGWSYSENKYVEVYNYKAWRSDVYVASMYEHIRLRGKYKIYTPTEEMIYTMGLELSADSFRYIMENEEWEPRPERKEKIDPQWHNYYAKQMEIYRKALELVNKNRTMDLKQDMLKSFNDLENLISCFETSVDNVDVGFAKTSICKMEDIIRKIEGSKSLQAMFLK